jgi:hypothetical protein
MILRDLTLKCIWLQCMAIEFHGDVFLLSIVFCQPQAYNSTSHVQLMVEDCVNIDKLQRKHKFNANICNKLKNPYIRTWLHHFEIHYEKTMFDIAIYLL